MANTRVRGGFYSQLNENLNELCESTMFDSIVLLDLFQQELITRQELETIKANPSKFERATDFYTRIILRYNSTQIERFLGVLDRSRNSRALQILRKFPKISPEELRNSSSLDNGREASNNLPGITGTFGFTIGTVKIFGGEKEVGHGGSGKVFKGTYKTDNQIVAIKVVQEDSIEKEKWKELDILQEVEHPNIVRYFGFEFDEPKRLYAIILELADTDLDKWLKQDSNKTKTLLKSVIVDISRGLNALHTWKTPIVHRDLKPSNILIFGGTDVVAKLADFGLSRIVLPNKTGITTQNPGLGTSGWMSPEQIKGSDALKLTPAVDVFSFGLVVNFILTERKHLYAKSQSEPDTMILLNILQDQRVWHESPQFSHFEFEELLKCVTNKDPNKRPRMQEITRHPLMWDIEKSFQFIEAVRTSLYLEKDLHDFSWQIMLNDSFNKIWGGAAWDSRLCPIGKKYLDGAQRVDKDNKRSRKYGFIYVSDLIEFIYDSRYVSSSSANNGELNTSKVFGDQELSHAKYFLELFPELVPRLFEFLQQEQFRELVAKHSSPLESYFKCIRPDAFTFNLEG